jgi:hypothetical protein
VGLLGSRGDEIDEIFSARGCVRNAWNILITKPEYKRFERHRLAFGIILKLIEKK